MTRRILSLEREITHEAARGACDPERLIAHSEVRARTLSHEYVADSMLIADRDRQREAREELSDCRNHLVWLIQAHIGDERADDALIALRFVCLAYDRLI